MAEEQEREERRWMADQQRLAELAERREREDEWRAQQRAEPRANAWNDHQRAMGGQGHSRQAIRDAYWGGGEASSNSGVRTNSAGRPIHENGRFMSYSDARARGWRG